MLLLLDFDACDTLVNAVVGADAGIEVTLVTGMDAGTDSDVQDC